MRHWLFVLPFHFGSLSNWRQPLVNNPTYCMSLLFSLACSFLFPTNTPSSHIIRIRLSLPARGSVSCFSWPYSGPRLLNRRYEGVLLWGCLFARCTFKEKCLFAARQECSLACCWTPWVKKPNYHRVAVPRQERSGEGFVDLFFFQAHNSKFETDWANFRGQVWLWECLLRTKMTDFMGLCGSTHSGHYHQISYYCEISFWLLNYCQRFRGAPLSHFCRVRPTALTKWRFSPELT